MTNSLPLAKKGHWGRKPALPGTEAEIWRSLCEALLYWLCQTSSKMPNVFEETVTASTFVHKKLIYFGTFLIEKTPQEVQFLGYNFSKLMLKQPNLFIICYGLVLS